MKKKYQLKIVSVIAVVTVGTFLGLSLVQSAPAPGPSKWSAIILPGSSNLQALPDPNRVYVDGQEGITISTGSSTCGSGKNMTFYTHITFQVALPSQILFSLGALDPGEVSPPAVVCGFPVGGNIWPECLANFLNQPQPYEGYHFVYFYFSTPGCEDRISSDFTKMEIGTWLKMNLTLRLRSDNIDVDCPYGCGGGHSIDARAHGWIHDGQLLPDIWVYRDSENEWTVNIDTSFDNPGFQTYPPPLALRDLIWEYYCECVLKTGKGGRTYYEKQFVDAAWTRTHLAFQIKFIKTQ